jgi:serine/threonine protein kinase
MSEPQYPDFTAHGYQVIEQLGRNSSAGRVSYKALSINTRQIVVIKQFQWVGGSSTLDGERQIEREIQTLRSFHHPKIPSYLDDFKTEFASFCIVQEFIDAQTLSENNDFTPQEIKSIAIQLLEILVYLQRLLPPIIHRDIKPENILVDDNLNVYLIDFGFAKIGEGRATALSSIALGTPGFMSPEQVNNLPLTEATDLYGLGATLICLLCKIKSTDFVDIVDYNFQINFKTRVSHLAFSFIEWLDKLVRLNPDQRFPNAQEALNALLPLELIRIPELHLSQSSFTCEAGHLGEKIRKNIKINNPIPETVLEGSIISYRQNESHRINRHDWLTIYPKRFKSNQTSCTLTIDTSKLTANKVYQREIIFESNARQNNTPFNISIKTAPLPRPILPPYLLLAGIYLIFTIGSKFVWIQDNLILQLSITILAALAVFGMDSILILIGTMAIMYLGAIVGTMMAFLPDFIISLATSLDIITINIAMPMNRHGYLFPTSASLGLLFGICHAFVLVGNTNNPNSKNEKKIIDETSFVYIVIWLVYLAVTFTFILPYFIGNTFLPMPVLHWVSFGLLDFLFLTIFKIFWGYLFGVFVYLPLSLNRHIFYMFFSKRLRFFFLPIVNLSFTQKGYTRRTVILLHLYLTIGLAVASGIGSQVGWDNFYILTTLLITGIPLLILLLFPPIYYTRIITKYSKNIY